MDPSGQPLETTIQLITNGKYVYKLMTIAPEGVIKPVYKSIGFKPHSPNYGMDSNTIMGIQQNINNLKFGALKAPIEGMGKIGCNAIGYDPNPRCN
jgi:hypothetical protein